MPSVRRPALTALAAAALVGLVVGAASRFAGPADRAAQWKKVHEAVDKGLPKTAIEELEPIIESALNDKAYPEAIKAIAKKIALEGNIQGNKPEERITRMQAEIAKAPKEMVPVMDAVLAHWYWHYFQQNRWRFIQRTTAGERHRARLHHLGPAANLHRDRQPVHRPALADEKELKATPVGTYDALLEKGTVPDTYRPTLYDFVAFEALAFYTSGEQAGEGRRTRSRSTADSPVLGAVDEFLTWKPKTTDTDLAASSRRSSSTRSYSRSTRTTPTSRRYLDADLSAAAVRVQHRGRRGEERPLQGRHQAVRRGVRRARALRHGPLPVGGGRCTSEGDCVEARKVALPAANGASPNSPGGKLCHNLVAADRGEGSRSRSPSGSGPTRCRAIRVTYKNLDQGLLPRLRRDRLGGPGSARSRWRPEEQTTPTASSSCAPKPASSSPPTCRPRRTTTSASQDVPAPKDLTPGFYFLFASHGRRTSAQADNPSPPPTCGSATSPSSMRSAVGHARSWKGSC